MIREKLKEDIPCQPTPPHCWKGPATVGVGVGVLLVVVVLVVVVGDGIMSGGQQRDSYSL